jgi:hypothetical protein
MQLRYLIACKLTAFVSIPEVLYVLTHIINSPEQPYLHTFLQDVYEHIEQRSPNITFQRVSAYWPRLSLVQRLYAIPEPDPYSTYVRSLGAIAPDTLPPEIDFIKVSMPEPEKKLLTRIIEFVQGKMFCLSLEQKSDWDDSDSMSLDETHNEKFEFISDTESWMEV